MPSLTDGGALWFTDLTVADPMYVLPVACSALIWATVELGAADGMQGQDPALMRNMKIGMRAVAVILIPVTASMPQVTQAPLSPPTALPCPAAEGCCGLQGVFIYWITSNMWSLAQASSAPCLLLRLLLPSQCTNVCTARADNMLPAVQCSS